MRNSLRAGHELEFYVARATTNIVNGRRFEALPACSRRLSELLSLPAAMGI